jgi:hypothetical protein
MGKTRLVLGAVALVALATSFAVFSGLKHTSELPDLTGTWKSWRSSFRISKGFGRYDVEVANPDGFLAGTYSGVPRAGAIEMTGPLSALCGEMKYVKDADKLEFCGEEFQRIRSSSPSTLSSRSVR